ncbi:hypothetical protein OIU84_012926 [Salix udensis]|uniref:Uncharacterized protein n=1 Tax=Salix udensis TaxID=889485 RepID=A0AAD6NU62_9ROSI|nr:hypothetical protein OIU84_012926 [Salix udensis]
MKTIQWIKVKFRKLRDNKADEQRRRLNLIYEGSHQVLAERDSLKDQLSEANRKLADLENMVRAFQAQASLHHQVSHGKKEEDDGKDKEIERLKGEIGIKNSLITDQQSVGEKVKKRFEYRIEAKDERIRLLKYELAMKDIEIRSLKSQEERRKDRREEEYTRLRDHIRNAVATLGGAFMFRVENPPEKSNYYSYDLIGAKTSAGDQREQDNQKFLG